MLTCLIIVNDSYMGRTAPLTSKRSILYIYSTNVGTEYFKHALYSPIFCSSKCSLFHNANLFGSCIIHILYIGCAKIKKIIPVPKVKVYYNNMGYIFRLLSIHPQALQMYIQTYKCLMHVCIFKTANSHPLPF